jgi:6-phosphogluconate dehydrogenase
MEYIISQKKLYQLIFRYFDDFRKHHTEFVADNFLYIYDTRGDAEGEFWYLVEYSLELGELTLSKETLNIFKTYFPLPEEDLLELFKDWFERTYDTEVTEIISY